MIDLRQLTHRWTEDGARAIFAELVTQCVRSLYPSAEQIRPNPGDEGIDTFVGRFRNKSLKIWQSKYFPDGVGDSQKKQIRESFKSCLTAKSYEGFRAWTLCLPVDLSTAETKWWQGWKERQQRDHECAIDLWSHSQFVRFYSKLELRACFDCALDVARQHADEDAAQVAMQGTVAHLSLETLPSADHLGDANFVRKLEAAGVAEHRAARTAFYNFELLRQAIEQGGNAEEVGELRDLLERLYDSWSSRFNAATQYGRSFFTSMEQSIADEDRGYLRTTLPAHLVHKKGGLYYWADLCEAGWTEDFRSIADSDEDSER